MALDSAFRDLTLRRARILRNLLSDPLPRDKELVFEGYDYVYPEVAFHCTAMGRSYCTRMKLGAGVPKDAIDALPARTREIVFGVIGLALAPFHFLLSDFAAIRVRHPCLTFRSAGLLLIVSATRTWRVPLQAGQGFMNLRRNA
jgi:hypothetical protein